MKIGYKEFMKNPAKAMKRIQRYNQTTRRGQERLRSWLESPEGKERLAVYMRKQGYQPDQGNESKQGMTDSDS